jgi:hypothetical protein
MRTRQWQVGSDTDRPIIRGSVRYVTPEELEAERIQSERRYRWLRWRQDRMAYTITIAVWAVLILAGLVALVANN